jgi:hypothetical protein
MALYPALAGLAGLALVGFPRKVRHGAWIAAWTAVPVAALLFACLPLGHEERHDRETHDLIRLVRGLDRAPDAIAVVDRAVTSSTFLYAVEFLSDSVARRYTKEQLEAALRAPKEPAVLEVLMVREAFVAGLGEADAARLEARYLALARWPRRGAIALADRRLLPGGVLRR